MSTADLIAEARAHVVKKATPCSCLDRECNCDECDWCGSQWPCLTRRLVDALEALQTWGGLMSILDEHYPDDIWLPGEDAPTMDPGHRVVAALRRVDKLRRVEAASPRVVSTVAELDALPPRTVLLDRSGDAFQNWRLGESWMGAGDELSTPSGALVLPATVLWVGGTE